MQRALLPRWGSSISPKTKYMRRILIVLPFLLATSCHVGESIAFMPLGLFEIFVETHGIPYEAPEDKWAISESVLKLISDDNIISILPDDIFAFICSPDDASLVMYGDADVVGLSLSYILRLKEKSYRQATYLSIQFNKRYDTGSLYYIQDGEISRTALFSKDLLMNKIYPLEEKYKDVINELKSNFGEIQTEVQTEILWEIQW